jgi:hypothetical protein
MQRPQHHDKCGEIHLIQQTLQEQSAERPYTAAQGNNIFCVLRPEEWLSSRQILQANQLYGLCIPDDTSKLSL